MENILIFIKHKIPFIWSLVEKMNETLFSLYYKGKLEKVLSVVFEEFKTPPYLFKKLTFFEIDSLQKLINQQTEIDLKYFHPHGFYLIALKKQLTNKSFLMMGAFEKEKMVGYFFLRFFANKKCFVGRLIDKEHRGRGIGAAMNNIMYETGWRLGFRCLSTISLNNTAVIRAHAKNSKIVVLKELQNNYLLVEFVRDVKSSRQRNGQVATNALAGKLEEPCRQ